MLQFEGNLTGISKWLKDHVKPPGISPPLIVLLFCYLDSIFEETGQLNSTDPSTWPVLDFYWTQTNKMKVNFYEVWTHTVKIRKIYLNEFYLNDLANVPYSGSHNRNYKQYSSGAIIVTEICNCSGNNNVWSRPLFNLLIAMSSVAFNNMRFSAIILLQVWIVRNLNIWVNSHMSKY